MEKGINKVILGVAIISLIVSVVAIVFTAASYKKIAKLQGTNSNLGMLFSGGKAENDKPSTAPKPGSISFAGFAGKLTSVKTENVGGMKIFELRGHDLNDPKSTFEIVSSEDSKIKKVSIDSKTKINRIDKNGDLPEVIGISFDEFATNSADETYIIHYEVGEGAAIDENTPAYSISVYSGNYSKILER